MALLRWFFDTDPSDVVAGGGKGADLATMVRAGLPVLPGFMVLTTAYPELVARGGLRRAIARLAAVARADEPAGVAAAAAAIGELFPKERWRRCSLRR